MLEVCNLMFYFTGVYSEDIAQQLKIDIGLLNCVVDYERLWRLLMLNKMDFDLRYCHETMGTREGNVDFK